ncbi:hypothetical protein BDV28DRAFT_141935 [Aspergillus coremiiformis]|uniref:Uncharacterized protein n=1 Tax=Aspergillus coremiiformis TaxID=138285 RepID=A0A5N6YVZ9_9EURO|nr:hypothetical protein BDV28DRAFT_141935 [Aspergillus coremiiformis]
MKLTNDFACSSLCLWLFSFFFFSLVPPSGRRSTNSSPIPLLSSHLLCLFLLSF